MSTTPAQGKVNATTKQATLPVEASQNIDKDPNTKRIVQLGGGVELGGQKVQIFAGPCAVETTDQFGEIAHVVKDSGVSILRGGVYKLRTSPNSFQGLGEKGFEIVAQICHETGLKFVTEAIDEESLELVDAHADMIQIGTRNMHNYPLLKKAGKCRKPILLKRGFSASLEEFLLAAQYILNAGNESVVLCERGIRTFCKFTRFTLDLNIVPALKERTDLPVMVDVSHGTGERNLVSPMALAAIACGADGVMVEVHNAPDEALSDGKQSIDMKTYRELVPKMRAVAEAVGRSV